MSKTKKKRKNKTANITLEPDGFSIHTFQISMRMTQSEWLSCKRKLYDAQKKGDGWIYPDKEQEGCHICTLYAEAGVRIRLESHTANKGSSTYFVRMIVNPRRLIDPESSYAGILPPDENSIELLEKTFYSTFQNSPFPSDICQYYLTRVDLCTNIHCKNTKVFRELVRLLRKTAVPKKYKRKFFRHKTKKEANQYNKHYIRIACDLQELVIYDKTYQMDEDGLAVAYEELPQGVLRVEVHYGRNKLKKIEKQNDIDDPLDLLWYLMTESRRRILKLVGKCYPELPYYSYEEGCTMIQRSPFSEEDRDRMLLLFKHMQRKQTINAAFTCIKNKGKQTDDLLKKFEKLGLNPIPLRKGHAAKRMPSLPEILRTVGRHPVEIELEYWEWK